jgi:hypothetical protein
MRIATATLVSTAAYSPSRTLDGDPDYVKPKRGEYDKFERENWRKKCHALPDGTVFIPPMAFKMALDRAAQMLGQRIPGKAQATYGKYFLSGVLCMEPVALGINVADTVAERIYANADGVRGSGKRVWRIYPKIEEWKAVVDFHVLASEIPNEVFEEHLRQAGAFVGVGRFRPQSGGFYGRFKVEKVRWG